MSDLTKAQLDSIAADQLAYYTEAIPTGAKDAQGEDVTRERGAYRQMLLSKGLGYEVHVHDGPDGKGFTVIERKTVDGVEYVKKTGYGAHSSTQEWVKVATPKE